MKEPRLYCGMCGDKRPHQKIGHRWINPNTPCAECRTDNPAWITDPEKAAFLWDTRPAWMRRESIHPDLLP